MSNAGERPFGYTGAPGTCKWCGRKLRQMTRAVFGPDSSRPPVLCAYELVPHGIKQRREICESTKIRADGDHWVCDQGHRFPMATKKIGRKKTYEKLGDYGDGHFCGLRCGYAFGLRLADTDYILEL